MRKFWVALLWMIFSSALMTQAQDVPDTLIFWVRGDLYAANLVGLTPAPLTADGTISGPSLSPDRRYIVYKTLPALARDALTRLQTTGVIANYDLPGDIVIFDRVTGVFTTIATQPINASLFVDGMADVALVRSAPVWSPAGDAFAWSEFDFAGETVRIQQYTLATGETSLVIEGIPLTDPARYAPEIHWGTAGIAVQLLTEDVNASQFAIVTPTATHTVNVQLSEGETLALFAWLNHSDGREYLAVLYSSGRWQAFDPITGFEVVLNGTPYLYAVGAGSTSIRITFSYNEDVGFFWEAFDPLAPSVASVALPAPPNRVTISPDGRQIAALGYPDFGRVSIWNGGDFVPITGTGSAETDLAVGAVLWGQTAWAVMD